MVSHQNGSVLTVSSHIASPAQGVWTHLQPPRCFYGLLLCLQFWKLRPRTRSRNINGRLIWHKISPFGPGLCRTSDFLPTDNKNYSLSPICPPQVSPGPIEGEESVTSIEVTEVGVPGSRIVIISVITTKRQRRETLDWAIWFPGSALNSSRSLPGINWSPFMCQRNNGSEKMWFESTSFLI